MIHNKIKFHILVSIIATLSFSCSDKKEYNIQYYKKHSSVDNWGDSIFLSNVNNLQIHGDKLYFMDRELSQIFEISKDFSLSRVIGNKGEGPRDFISLETMVIADSLIYVFDAGHASFMCFNLKGEFENSYKFSDDQLYPLYRSILENSCLVVTTNDKKGAFAHCNIKTGSVDFWGKRTLFDHEKKNQIRNNRHILKYKDKYISVSDNIPMIEFYDSNKKELIETLDYSDIEDIQKAILKNKNTEDPRSYYIIAKDLYIDNNKLYILLNGDKKDTYYANRILEVDLLPTITKSKIIQLPGDVYKSICVSNDTIYAYNSSEAKIELLIKE